MTSPERNSHLNRLAEQALRSNLQNATEVARHQPSNRLWTVLLVDTNGGKLSNDLPADCDTINRAMLSKLYELSHVDERAASVKVGIPASTPGLIEITTLQTPHDFHFVENHTQLTQTDGSLWESFSVTGWSNDFPYLD